MRLLLDTHTLLWGLYSPERVPARTRAVIADTANPVFVSYAAIWEISVKTSRGKLPEAGSSAEYVLAELPRLQMEPLRISMRHILAVEKLPRLHGDPFDRIMLAQAAVEKLTFVTSDAMNQRYPVETLW